MLTKKKQSKSTTLTLMDENCLASSLTDGVTCTSSDGCSSEFWGLLPPFSLSVQEQTRTSWCRRSRAESLPVSSSSSSCTTSFDTFVWHIHNTRTHTHRVRVSASLWFFLKIYRVRVELRLTKVARACWNLSTGKVGKDFGK